MATALPAKQTAEQETEQPDFYANQKWMIGEIVLAYQILGRKIGNLSKQNEARTAVGQKLAAEEVSRISEQLKVCADIIGRTSADYSKRRPR